MKLITDMIENLTFKLDTVKLYLEQFPDSKRLHGCASSVILAYVRFCISALKFLTRQLPICILYPTNCRALGGPANEDRHSTPNAMEHHRTGIPES